MKLKTTNTHDGVAFTLFLTYKNLRRACMGLLALAALTLGLVLIGSTFGAMVSAYILLTLLVLGALALVGPVMVKTAGKLRLNLSTGQWLAVAGCGLVGGAFGMVLLGAPVFTSLCAILAVCLCVGGAVLGYILEVEMRVLDLGGGPIPYMTGGIALGVAIGVLLASSLMTTIGTFIGLILGGVTALGFMAAHRSLNAYVDRKEQGK